VSKVKAAKVPTKRIGRRELYATVCWYYPQYNLNQVSKLPARDIDLLIRVARKREAMKFYNLAQVSAAARARKGNGMRKIIDHFRKVAEE
jgi:hypothetical protein